MVLVHQDGVRFLAGQCRYFLDLKTFRAASGHRFKSFGYLLLTHSVIGSTIDSESVSLGSNPSGSA